MGGKKRGLSKPASDSGPQCDGCPYRTRSLGYVEPGGTDDTNVCFVTDHPTLGAVEAGRPLGGGEGRIFRGLLERNTGLRRDTVKTVPGVRCCPVEWENCSHCGGQGCEAWTTQYSYEFQCDDGRVPKLAKHSLNFIRVQPSAGQIKECAKRYLKDELDAFEGDTLVGLGTVAMRSFGAKGVVSGKANGSIYEYAERQQCTNCSGVGTVTVMVRRKCRLCPKPTYKDPEWRCAEHRRYAGRSKPRRLDCDCMLLYTQAWDRPLCVQCGGTKEHQVEKTGKCPECKGKGHPVKKGDAHVLHSMLKPGQLLIATYDPLELMKKQNHFNAVDAVFRRIEKIHDEDCIEEGDYTYYPDPQEQFTFGPRISVDIETPFGGDPDSDPIYMGSISDAPERSVVFKPDDPRFLSALENAEQVIGQNYTLFDAWWLYKKLGTRPKSIFDTRFAGHLLNPDTPNDLTTLSVEYAIPRMEGYWKSANNYKNKLESVCALDTDGAYRVSHGQTEAMQEMGVWPLFRDQVIPLSSITLDMRIAGQRINVEKMRSLRESYLRQLETMRTELPFEGTESSRKLVGLIYDQWGLPQVNVREGERNTRKDTLTTLAEKLRTGEIVSSDWEYKAQTLENILAMRKMSKLASAFLSYQFPEGHEFVHPALNIAGTGTLRLSCSNPNAQQIPPDTRPLFIPDDPSRELTSVDIKQAEVVSFLWLAEEWDLYEQVLAGADMHQLVADLCGITRYEAKTTTFALLFGEEPSTTAVRLGTTIAEVGRIREAYFQALPGVGRFRAGTVRFCRDNNYVLSPWNTRRHIRLEDWQYKGHAINQAMNTPIQSTPAIAIRQAMVYAAQGLPGDARLWMQVHDEIIVEHDRADRDAVVQVLRDAVMDAVRCSLLVGNPYSLSGNCPQLEFGLDFSHGQSWGEL